MEWSQEKLSKFLKTGIIVLSAMVLIACSFKIAPIVVETISGVQKKQRLISSVETQKLQVSLSFDAIWGDEDTSDILRILEKHNVKATFFMSGSWIETYPDAVKMIAAAGHDLGNYGENYKQMSKLTKKQCKEEIMDVHDRVRELTNVDMKLFRPPYGIYNETVLKTANACGYYVIGWNVDSMDWKDYGTESIKNKVVNNKNLNKGSIVLLHSGTKHTAEALEQVIVSLQEKGYEIVPVSELVSE